MKLILILSGPYSACAATQQVWQNACKKQQLELEVQDMEQEEGQLIANKYDLKSFPALIVDGHIAAVGHPDQQTAENIIAGLQK